MRDASMEVSFEHGTNEQGVIGVNRSGQKVIIDIRKQNESLTLKF